MNIYTLNRRWFDFAFVTKEAKSHHTALFCWIVELNNRLGWKSEFGLPTQDTMEGLSIGNKNTYLTTLRNLADWGFIEIVKESKNQYQSCVISICRVKSDTAQDTALDTALIQHDTQHCSSTEHGIGLSTVPIDRPIYNSTILPIYVPSIIQSSEELDQNFEVENQVEPNGAEAEEKEKSSAQKENDLVPTPGEADAFFQKHYTSLYELVRKDNKSAATPELRLAMLERFWAENLDEYKNKMPPWGDIIKHFRNWVPQYTLVKQGRQTNQNFKNNGNSFKQGQRPQRKEPSTGGYGQP